MECERLERVLVFAFCSAFCDRLAWAYLSWCLMLSVFYCLFYIFDEWASGVFKEYSILCAMGSWYVSV